MNRLRNTMAVLLLLAISSLFTAAQTSRGILTGTIKDPSGAVIPNAKITLINTGTNVTRTATSNGAGLYRFDAVDLGLYTILVEATNYGSASSKNVSIEAARSIDLDFELKPGAGRGETVEVNATAAEVLQTTEQTRNRNIDSVNLVELPIGGQNSLNLILNLPGVVSTSMGGSLDSGIGSVNGSRPRANNFLIDGVQNNDISVHGPAITLTNNDAIQEVNIQTANYSAEFGNGGGAVVNQITKSGTNKIHGTAAWVYQSEAMNAASSVDKLGSGSKSKFNDNTPAFTLGGPVVIPGLYDGHNRTFWFAAGQWDRFNSGSANFNFTVPTAAGLAILQPLAASCPNVQRYLNAISGLVAPTQTSTVDISIPANIFTVTGSCNGTARTGQIVGAGVATRVIPVKAPTDNQQYRVDHKISDKQQISFRYLYNASNQLNGGTVGTIHAFDADFSSVNYSGLLSHTYVINNRATNEFRFDYSRITLQFPLSTPANALTLAPTFAFGGLTAIGINGTFPQGRIANNFQYQDTVSLVRGRHEMRMGVDMLRQLARQQAPGTSRGAVTYSSTPSSVTGSTPITGFANFIDDFNGGLTGNAGVTNNYGSFIYRPNLFSQAYFFQDNWKLTSNFTVNLGLRYEFYGQPANFFKIPVVSLDPATATTPNSANSDKNNFAPTIGFAWNPHSNGDGLISKLLGNGKTVIRGGFQTVYDSSFNNLLSNMAAGAPNNPVSQTIGNTVNATTPRGDSGLYTTVFPALAPAAFSPLAGFASQFSNNMRSPYTDHYSFGIQRELGAGMVLDTSYVGSQSRKLFETVELNPIVPNATLTGPTGTTATTSGRVINTVGARQPRINGANSNYNSLQVELRNRYKETRFGGLQFNTNYTWSKSLDTTSEVFATNNTGGASALASARLAFLTNRHIDYGPSDFDRRHRWATTFVWDIRGPKSGFLGQVFGGWSFTSVIPVTSGVPFTVLNGQDRDFDGSSALDRPDVGNVNAPVNTYGITTSLCATGLYNPNASGFLSNGTTPGGCVAATDVHWIQVAGYSLPGAKTEKRNSMFTPGSWTVNSNILKKFKIREGLSLEYRAEIFDIFNHENFNQVPALVLTASPNTFLNYNNVGAATSRGNRNMRMGLKIIF
jgi:outer membrane receptor protein involved in Fe transport